MSLAAAAGNPHAAAVVAAAAAAGKAGGSNNSRSSGSGAEPVVRTLPPLPPSAGQGGSGNTRGSGNSRCSAGGSSSDKPGAGSSVGSPQLQLVQRLPSLTGGTPRLVHKVETWLVQVRLQAAWGCGGLWLLG